MSVAHWHRLAAIGSSNPLVRLPLCCQLAELPVKLSVHRHVIQGELCAGRCDACSIVILLLLPPLCLPPLPIEPCNVGRVC